MFVYEMHLASWKKPEDGREFYNYRELAPMIVAYVKEMQKAFKKKNIQIDNQVDYANDLWEDRPAESATAVYNLPVKYAGKSAQQKIEELRSKRSLVMSLEDYSRLANAQYQGGYTGYFTVLQAEQSLLPQQISLAEVKSRALNSVAQVYQALGGGWIDQALIEEQQAIREIEEAEKLKKQPIKPTTAQPMQKSADG